jgi:hypothetical protein
MSILRTGGKNQVANECVLTNHAVIPCGTQSLTKVCIFDLQTAMHLSHVFTVYTLSTPKQPVNVA